MPLSRYVWDRVVANGLARGGTTIYWYLDYRFRGSDPWEFTIEWAPQEEGPWVTQLDTTTQNFYTDAVRRQYGKYKNSYYRVILTDGDANTYTSPVVSSCGIWNRHDFLLAKEIARKEYLLQSKYVGRVGYLYKRYTIGTPCTVCIDFDTNEPTKAICDTCFGTGIVGGYAPPIEVWMTADMFSSAANLRDNADQEDPIKVNARVVGFPDIAVGDFWADKNTDDRYMVRNQSVKASLRGQCIVSELELRLVPVSDKIYEIPTDWDGGL